MMELGGAPVLREELYLSQLDGRILNITEAERILAELEDIISLNDEDKDDAYDSAQALEARIEIMRQMESESLQVRDAEVVKLKGEIENLQVINKSLIDTTKKLADGNATKVLVKEDLMKEYGWGSDKALNVLKLLTQNGYGTKIGKQYSTTWQDLQEYLKINPRVVL